MRCESSTDFGGFLNGLETQKLKRNGVVSGSQRDFVLAFGVGNGARRPGGRCSALYNNSGKRQGFSLRVFHRTPQARLGESNGNEQ